MASGGLIPATDVCGFFASLSRLEFAGTSMLMSQPEQWQTTDLQQRMVAPVCACMVFNPKFIPQLYCTRRKAVGVTSKMADRSRISSKLWVMAEWILQSIPTCNSRLYENIVMARRNSFRTIIGALLLKAAPVAC